VKNHLLLPELYLQIVSKQMLGRPRYGFHTAPFRNVPLLEQSSQLVLGLLLLVGLDGVLINNTLKLEVLEVVTEK
jgi:hypothetical protein